MKIAVKNVYTHFRENGKGSTCSRKPQQVKHTSMLTQQKSLTPPYAI